MPSLSPAHRLPPFGLLYYWSPPPNSLFNRPFDFFPLTSALFLGSFRFSPSTSLADRQSLFLMHPTLLLLLLLLSAAAVTVRATRLNPLESVIRMPTEKDEPEAVDDHELGTRWAVLVAGSSGFDNYRHQDYTGEHVTAANLYAVLLGDKSALTGGSGKVVDSKPNDRIFLYYADHGGPGVLGMPNLPYLYAMDFIDVLKKKHASGGYKEMVIYVEACESGSIFEGIMPKDLNIYVMTASNAQENSWGTYCPGMEPSPPPEFITCLGDLYSIAWMEDSETHNLKRETMNQQYESVKDRTSNFNTFNMGFGSHVMEYGTTDIKAEKLYLYQGFDPASVNLPPNYFRAGTRMETVNQRDADVLFLWHMYKNLEDGSEKKIETLKQITETVRHRIHLDSSIDLIGKLLYGPTKGSAALNYVREPGLPLVDDWECLKYTVRVFETQCGSLTQYGMKHMRAFANICNSGVSQALVEEACMAACTGHETRQRHPSNQGYSA